MANAMLKRGGKYRYNFSSLAKQLPYDGELNDAPERIGDEYHHGFFTVGNAFNPMYSTGQAEVLDKLKTGVGDFIGLFVVPEFHTLMDVAVRVFPTQSEYGYNANDNAQGLTFTVEARKYNDLTGEETGVVELVTDLAGIAANQAGFKRTAIKPTEGGYTTEAGEVVVLGLKVESLPTNAKLSEVTCRVEVTGHVADYECPMHL